MNPKHDRWESYTDKTGRRHWRWPAADALAAREARVGGAVPAPRAGGAPAPSPVSLGPLATRGK